MNSLEWLQFILSYLLQVSLVIALAMGLERWSTASRLKARIWTICYVSILMLFLTGIVLPRLQWFHPWSTLQPKDLFYVATAEDTAGRILLAIWVLGASVVATRWILHFLMLQRLLRSCPRLPALEYRRLLAQTSAKPRVNGRKLEFRIGPEEFGPFCYQFHSPIICLPQSIISGHTETLEHVLRHELAHLETEHPLQLFFQKLVQTVLWFHPLVWISTRRAALVREFVCDDAAISEDRSAASYLRALVKVIEERAAHQTNTLAIGRSGKELATRARRLAAEIDRSSDGRGWLTTGALLALVGLCTQFWLPTSPLASSRSHWSPWPTWSAAALHAFNIPVRDYELFDHDKQLDDWMEEAFEFDDRRS